MSGEAHAAITATRFPLGPVIIMTATGPTPKIWLLEGEEDLSPAMLQRLHALHALLRI